MGAEIRIEGIDVLQRKLRDIGADVHKELSDAGKKGMLVLEAEIKRNAPVSPGGGEYRDSWNTQATDEGDNVVVKTGSNRKVDSPGSPGSNDFPLGIYLEYGTGIHAEKGNGRKTPWAYTGADGETYFTHGMEPQPHIRPAIDSTQEQIGKVVRAELEKELRRRLM